MNRPLSAKNKLLAALVLVVTLGVVASWQGLTVASLARAALAMAAVVGLAAWLHRARGATGRQRFELKPRLEVISRTSLSARAAVALVEADGRSFLVVHGEGYAQVHPTREVAAPSASTRPAIDTDRFAALVRRPISRRAVRHPHL